MKVKLADKFGFCFGVRRAIKITEDIALKNPHTITFGPLIHNPKETERLQAGFNVKIKEDITKVDSKESVIIRTHGITKQDLSTLKHMGVEVTDATCPYVTKPQQIVEKMSEEGYFIVIFGDASHPEVRGVMSYSVKDPLVVGSLEELENIDRKLGKKVALVSQTTKQVAKFVEVANYLITHCQEVRIYNTICNATFENQDAIEKLSKEVDIMIVVGGLTSSNTKQLLHIAKLNCKDSFLVEDEKGLNIEWFKGKKLCGISAGASTPMWLVSKVKDAIENI
ncbi:4-hydroxy-3-methylbut-2-enyl diphosphate reductase [Helicobacter sp. 13S00401-1]|uniref:4-hydroxy-3-methylbut-2-enyl diphosphate reductase n=1 Tax=Helicobacter sp. 13S00401-1 TaxID=1905758 RepID=UPI000BA7E51F|nr:4-hydroxy-3-methylbut-2-enyl diphosphate reductase [Helicobacter sp. 13S00401-1]PAF51667.1 4-hydroxy-3-methylbut-2-enyl diphosphate reductase [Helicobacter sp. 13S00401-1]